MPVAAGFTDFADFACPASPLVRARASVLGSIGVAVAVAAEAVEVDPVAVPIALEVVANDVSVPLDGDADEALGVVKVVAVFVVAALVVVPDCISVVPGAALPGNGIAIGVLSDVAGAEAPALGDLTPTSMSARPEFAAPALALLGISF